MTGQVLVKRHGPRLRKQFPATTMLPVARGPAIRSRNLQQQVGVTSPNCQPHARNFPAMLTQKVRDCAGAPSLPSLNRRLQLCSLNQGSLLQRTRSNYLIEQTCRRRHSPAAALRAPGASGSASSCSGATLCPPVPPSGWGRARMGWTCGQRRWWASTSGPPTPLLQVSKLIGHAQPCGQAAPPAQPDHSSCLPGCSHGGRQAHHHYQR